MPYSKMAMPTDTRALIVRYGSAVLLAALATWLRLLFDPLFGDKFPFITYLVAVVFIAWYGGFGPALAALILSCLSAAYFVLPPRGSFLIHGFENQVGTGLFVFIGLVIAILCGSLRAAMERAERARAVE